MKPPDTRQQIILLADQLIRNRGYNDFSYADIAAMLEIRRPAIHYHFPTKSDLGIAVIDSELRGLWKHRSEWARMPGDEQLRRLICTFLNSSRAGELCLTGALTPELGSFSPAMQEKVGEMCQTILDWMGSCLEQARKAGSLHFEGAAKDRAILIMTTLAASLLLSRALDPSVFDLAVDRMLKDLGAGFGIAELGGAQSEQEYPW